MKKLLLSLSVILFAVSYAGQKTIITSRNTETAKVTGTYANSQTDTVWFTRQGGVSTMSFAIHTKDSVSITNAILFRQFNGVTQAVVVGDTLFSSYAAENTGIKIATITLSPLADIYYVKVAYAGSANGVTTPTVYYGLNASYNK